MRSSSSFEQERDESEGSGVRCTGIRRASGLATHRDASKPSDREAELLFGLTQSVKVAQNGQV